MKKQYPLPMTDAEILDSWNNAAVPAKQVKILTELNATSQSRIRDILIKMGVDESQLPKKHGPKPKPDSVTCEKVTAYRVDEGLREEPAPVADEPTPTAETDPMPTTASPARSELCASILTCVTDMLDKLTASKAVLLQEVEDLTARLKAKTEELAEVEKLIPVLYNCKTGVEAV